MPKPSPLDNLRFLEYLAQNQGRPFDPETLKEVRSDDPRSQGFDQAFFDTFPGSQAASEVAKAEDFEEFFKEHNEQSKLESLNLEQARSMERRREMLLRVLTLLEWAKKADQIPENTTLEALFKWVSSQVVKLAEAGKKTFSNEDKNALYLLKALVELKEEGMNENATTPDIIKSLDDKYEALKGIT